MTDSINDKYTLQSVANALDILDLLTEHEELSVPEVSKLTGLGKSSVFRLLATLESRHYVRKTAAAKYRLDIKLSGMAKVMLDRLDIIQYAHPHLMELSRVTGETTHLAIWDRDTHVRFIDKVSGTSSIHTDSFVGFSRPAHLLACGKVLLACRPKDFLRYYISVADFTPLTPNTIITGAQLEAELETVHRNGYAFDNEESELGLFCCAAPVKDLSGAVIAGISVSGPVHRMKENLTRNIAFIRQTAVDISNTLC